MRRRRLPCARAPRIRTRTNRFSNCCARSCFFGWRAVVFVSPGVVRGVVSPVGVLGAGLWAARDAADRAVLASIRADMAGYIGNRRQELVFQEWQKALLEAHGFEGAAAGADLLADAEEGDADADNEFPPEDE